MSREPKCALAEGFSVWEKAWAQVSFLVMGIVGTVAIVLTDWPWVFPYVVIYWYGVPGIVMRHLLCPRCPHLHVYGDCLQAPTNLTRWLIKEEKGASPQQAREVAVLRNLPSHTDVSAVLAGLTHGPASGVCDRCRCNPLGR
jgi:hypothetical protein